MKLKKIMRVLVAGIITVNLIMAMVGCASKESDATTGSGDTAQVGKETKEVEFWGTWSGEQGKQLQQIVEMYNESQDEYTVKYVEQEGVEDKLLTATASGQVPDVVMWDRYQTSLYASRNVLHNMDNLIARDNVDMAQFFDAPVSEMSFNGSQYGIPSLVDVRVIFYNKALFAEAGIQELPKTWDELAAVAETLTKRGDNGELQQSGFALSDVGLFNIYMMQSGGQLVNDDSTATAFNSQQGLDVLNFWNILLNDKKVYDIGFGDGLDGFADGTIAMKYDGPWSIANYHSVDGLDWGVMEPVTGKDGDKGAIAGGYGLVIPESAKNVEGAWDFIKWCTTIPENDIEFAKISGWFPANREACEDDYFTQDEISSIFIKTMEYAVTRPTVAGYSQVEGLALTPQLQNFVVGTVSAEEALTAAEEEGNSILKEEAEDN